MNLNLNLKCMTSWFSCWSSILVELTFGDVGFSGGRKTGENPEKNPHSKARTYDKFTPHMEPGACFWKASETFRVRKAIFS